MIYGQHRFDQDKEMLSTYEHLGVADGNEALDVLGVGFDVSLRNGAASPPSACARLRLSSVYQAGHAEA